MLNLSLDILLIKKFKETTDKQKSLRSKQINEKNIKSSERTKTKTHSIMTLNLLTNLILKFPEIYLLIFTEYSLQTIQEELVNYDLFIQPYVSIPTIETIGLIYEFSILILFYMFYSFDNLFRASLQALFLRKDI